MNTAHLWKDSRKAIPKYVEKNLMSLNAPQIPHGIVWDGTMVFSVPGRRLTS